MQALGIHTYAGGMQIGVSRVFDTLGSAESWRDGFRIREFMGLATRSVTEPAPVDLVFANPPCSRFSVSSMIKFDEDDRNDLSKFECLEEVLAFVGACKARTLWWETGPMAFNRGHGIIEQMHHRFGASVTWVIKINLLDIGVPQNRVRAHIIHFRDPVGKVPRLETVKRVEHVRDWLAARCTPPGTPAGPSEREMAKWGCKDPVSYVEVYSSVNTYKSFCPGVIRKGVARVVLARPQLLDDRWLTIEENAELMGYPQSLAQYEEHWEQTLRLMSKSVSSNVSEYLAKRVRLAMESASPDKACHNGIWALEARSGTIWPRAIGKTA